MPLITLQGAFNDGTGSVAWSIKGVNNTIDISGTENHSFQIPLNLPSGLYAVGLQGACSAEFIFDIKGNVEVMPHVPDTIVTAGGEIQKGYTLVVK